MIKNNMKRSWRLYRLFVLQSKKRAHKAGSKRIISDKFAAKGTSICVTAITHHTHIYSTGHSSLCEPLAYKHSSSLYSSSSDAVGEANIVKPASSSLSEAFLASSTETNWRGVTKSTGSSSIMMLGLEPMLRANGGTLAGGGDGDNCMSRKSISSSIRSGDEMPSSSSSITSSRCLVPIAFLFGRRKNTLCAERDDCSCAVPRAKSNLPRADCERLIIGGCHVAIGCTADEGVAALALGFAFATLPSCGANKVIGRSTMP
mmetsp:Transcript_53215/g.84957  ORF Transcript_53215/g.84957 Transcript_53215/m.84957 type:complete len:260 (+) Transcript_53215:998-1777(+)